MNVRRDIFFLCIHVVCLLPFLYIFATLLVAIQCVHPSMTFRACIKTVNMSSKFFYRANNPWF